MDLLQILGTGTAAGVVTFLLGIARDLFTERRIRARSAKIQAFDLSNKLKILSLTCGEILNQHQLGQPEEDGPSPPTLPKQDFLELARGLTDLDVSELAKIADLEMQKIVEEGYLSFGWSTWMDIDDIEKLQLKRLTFLKEESERLAAFVRRKYKLPEFGDHSALL